MHGRHSRSRNIHDWGSRLSTEQPAKSCSAPCRYKNSVLLFSAIIEAMWTKLCVIRRGVIWQLVCGAGRSEGCSNVSQGVMSINYCGLFVLVFVAYMAETDEAAILTLYSGTACKLICWSRAACRHQSYSQGSLIPYGIAKSLKLKIAVSTTSLRFSQSNLAQPPFDDHFCLSGAHAMECPKTNGEVTISGSSEGSDGAIKITDCDRD